MSHGKRQVLRPPQLQAAQPETTPQPERPQAAVPPTEPATEPARDPFREGLRTCARHMSKLLTSLTGDVAQVTAGLESPGERAAAVLPVLEELRRSGTAIARMAEAEKKIEKTEVEIVHLQLKVRSRQADVKMRAMEQQINEQTGKHFK